ncbi:hypothetical protein CRV24_005751 [Beauveria bassiana]|nr:hypothetical protein CRV24_005751 [Beauveria bassiana]
MPLAEGEKLLKEIEDTYTASYSAGVPRPELLSLCVSMASKYCQQGDLRKSVSLLLQGLSAFGYDIKAVLPTIDSAGSVSPTAQFEIKRWGMADGKVVEALVYLSMAATAIAPSLSRRILCRRNGNVPAIFPQGLITVNLPSGSLNLRRHQRH